MTPLAPALADWLARGRGVIVAEIVSAMGSTPRETGATMLIALDETLGSIGGGQLEFHAIEMARDMIATNVAQRDLDLPLGPNLGQCCGGRVVVRLARADAGHVETLAARDRLLDAREPSALIFGAGHTGKALARMLALLPIKTTLIDDRHDVFDDLPSAMATLRLDDPLDAIALAPGGAAFVILTHSHALDYALADAALRRGDAAYVGMIGSATKRARFERWFIQRGGARDTAARLVCPIGGAGVPDKRPEIIAALATADVTRALFSKPRSIAREAVDGRAA